jgi:hypothetical protein
MREGGGKARRNRKQARPTFVLFFISFCSSYVLFFSSSFPFFANSFGPSLSAYQKHFRFNWNENSAVESLKGCTIVWKAESLHGLKLCQ